MFRIIKRTLLKIPHYDLKINTITVNFIEKSTNITHKIKAPLGINILELAHKNNIELEGACECSLACSTCHVIVKEKKYFDKLIEPSEEEMDMLDLAYDLTDNSRLGCQIITKPEIDNIELIIPDGTRNTYF